MKIRKIIDTIENFGKAEHYILEADFERFLRRKYGVRAIKEIDAKEVVQKYNLKGVVFGNYVTQEERFFFLFKISKQLEALAKIKKSNDLGKGVLVVAFGVEGIGRANAHYNPQKQLINLNRGRKGNYREVLKGENSFVHEYGHFIDFVVGRADQRIATNFASENSLNELTGSSEITKQISSATNILLDDKPYMKQIEHSPYLSKNIEIFARLFETSLTHYINRYHKSYSIYFDRFYNQSIYYPKEKILKNKIDYRVAKILKTF